MNKLKTKKKNNIEHQGENSLVGESVINNTSVMKKNNRYIKLMAPLDKNFSDPLYLCPGNILGNVMEKVK